MKLQYSLLAAALLIWPLTGCNQQSPSPTPATVAAPDAESKTIEDQNPAVLAETHRIITDYSGDSSVAFTVSINDATIGSYNTDKVENDISSYLQPGINRVKIAWTADNSMNSAEAAQLKIQVKRGDDWNDIITREVRNNTAAGESVINIQVGKPAPKAAPPVAQSPTEEAPTPTTVETPGAQMPAAKRLTTTNPASLSEQYLLKTNFSALVPGDFTVAVNGSSIGSYSTDGNQDITSYLKKGQNSITINWKYASGSASYRQRSTLIIGVNRNGKWSTVGNASLSQEGPTGTKTFQFTAR